MSLSADVHAKTLCRRDVPATVRYTGGGGDGAEIRFRQGEPGEGGGGGVRDAETTQAVSEQIRSDAIVPSQGGKVRTCGVMCRERGGLCRNARYCC